MSDTTVMEQQIDATMAALFEEQKQATGGAALPLSSEVMVGRYKVTVSPGRLLVVKVVPENELSDGGIPIAAVVQEQHGQKLGIHFPMGGVLGVGPVDPTIPADAERIKFTEVDDVIWFDYRQAGEIMLAGRTYFLVPRQAVVGKVEMQLSNAPQTKSSLVLP